MRAICTVIIKNGKDPLRTQKDFRFSRFAATTLYFSFVEIKLNKNICYKGRLLQTWTLKETKNAEEKNAGMER